MMRAMEQDNEQTDKHCAYHAPPQRIGVAAEVRSTVVCHCVLLGQIDEVRWKYEAKESDIECRY